MDATGANIPCKETMELKVFPDVSKLMVIPMRSPKMLKTWLVAVQLRPHIRCRHIERDECEQCLSGGVQGWYHSDGWWHGGLDLTLSNQVRSNYQIWLWQHDDMHGRHVQISPWDICFGNLLAYLNLKENMHVAHKSQPFEYSGPGHLPAKDGYAQQSHCLTFGQNMIILHI